MNITGYVGAVPQIESWIREYRPDALVCGMGPTAWLLPWIDQSLLAGVRLWGCHDACRIMPMDDLVLMDSPNHALHPDTSRYEHIVKARPKRLWLYERNAPQWKGHVAPCMASVTQLVPFSVCRPNQAPRVLEKLKFKLVDNPLHTTGISPTGMTTLAWREGARRIGVIGVDMQKGSHHSYAWWPVIDTFFRKVAEQAQQLGGAIFNLSPFTSLQGFRQWKPSTSASAPTSGSVTPEPNSSSNPPSESTPPAESRSTGCGLETMDSKLAQAMGLVAGTSDASQG